MKKIIFALTGSIFFMIAAAQTAEDIIFRVKEKLDKVNDYEADGNMKTNVVFIKAPVAQVRIYYKKPNKLKIDNKSGISFIPKGSVNINLSNVFNNITEFDLIDAGKEESSGLRIIKLLPRDENTDVVLSTLFIDEKNHLVKKAKTTTRESGTYELEMTYGRYSEFGLADKVTFSFNTKEYKLPKGVTFDYDDGSGKKKNTDELKNKKGKVEIVYSSYIINKGLADSLFN
jgi:outer membrane lipoprotein-sorting protein